MTASIPDPQALKDWLQQASGANGFDVMAVTGAEIDEITGHRLSSFISQNYHGEMGWLADTQHRRQSPKHMWPDACTAIVLGCNYGPNHDPMTALGQLDRGNISVYARGRDYHDVLKGRLKQIAGQLASRSGWQVKVFVDTAPLMEKPLAAKAGIGWQGKHTNLVSRDYGSWLFLGVILTDGHLPADEVADDSCGSCTACLDICPTDAFPAPYQLDARRCISYLTIEYKGHIADEFRSAIGNRIYGCDDCLAVCPWNKFAQTSHEQKFTDGQDRQMPALGDLLSLDDAAFRQLFSGSPVKRTGYISFMRNVLIAAGNADRPALAADILPHLKASSEIVRAMAVWALSRYYSAEQLSQLYDDAEPDSYVRAEWQQALGH